MTEPVLLQGIAASDGIAIAPVLAVRGINLELDSSCDHDSEEEFQRFKTAQETAAEQIMILKNATEDSYDEWADKIFDSHLFLLSDPELQSGVEGRIDDGLSAEYALFQTGDELAVMLEGTGSDLMAERAADLRDVTGRMIALLTGQETIDLSRIRGECILAAADLSPLETARLNRALIKGIAIETGGYSCHTAIMARSRGIPAVTGAVGLLGKAVDGELCILDGGRGEVLINPGPDELEAARVSAAGFIKEKERLKAFIKMETRSRDGVRINIGANIGRPEELDDAEANGAEGVGLFRTEFIFMDGTDFPDEEEQFKVYRQVLERMNPRPVVIRTMDIGGDKKLSFADFPHEDNPFLGLRGLRWSLKNHAIFRTQLRALLRASAYGQLKIMFPMVSVKEEFTAAREILDNEAGKLRAEGIPVSEDVEVGVMIEVPSAALAADELADYADFFSIGTNDLIQYTMAADRMNEEVAYLYQPCHPAVTALIKIVCEASARRGLWTGVCGEMAADPESVSLLLSLGVTELSMSSPRIPAVREIVSKLDLSS